MCKYITLLKVYMYEYISLVKVYYNCRIMQHVIELQLLCLLLYNYRMLLDNYLNIFMQTNL